MGKRDLPVIMLLLPRILCSNHKKKLRRGGGGTGVTGNQGKERAEFKKSRGGEIRRILKDVLSNIQSENKLGLYKSKIIFETCKVPLAFSQCKLQTSSTYAYWQVRKKRFEPMGLSITEKKESVYVRACPTWKKNSKPVRQSSSFFLWTSFPLFKKLI